MHNFFEFVEIIHTLRQRVRVLSNMNEPAVNADTFGRNACKIMRSGIKVVRRRCKSDLMRKYFLTRVVPSFGLQIPDSFGS
jgi:hypothetical protein